MLRLVRKTVSSCSVPGQIRKMSSMYRDMSSGELVCVARKFRSTVDMKILAMVGEKVAPMAVPFICWNVMLSNVK